MSDVRVLAFTNLVASTGFSRVSEQILLNLCASGFLKPENVTVHAINFPGGPTPGLPFRIYPAQIAQTHDGDLFGRARFAHNALSGEYGPFDILWLLEDAFSLAWNVPVNGQVQPFMPATLQLLRQQVQAGQRPDFRVIEYIPIDADNPRVEWFEWINAMVDYPVAYTRYGRRVMCDLIPAFADKLGVIPHGTNPDTFYPVDPQQREAFRQQAIGLKPGQPLVVNVNRNQPRKDVPRTLQVFAEVRKQVPDAVLLLHCNLADSAGFNLDRVRQNLQIPSEAVKFPSNFSEGVGVPIEFLNMIYNAADVFVSTARGGGYELTMAEAMTAGVPVVVPDHTSHSEIVSDAGGGILVKPDPHKAYIILDNDQPRPVADVSEMAGAVVGLLKSPERRRVLGQRGRAWAERMSWKDHVVPQWQRIFEDAARSLGKMGPALPPPDSGPRALSTVPPVASESPRTSSRFQVNAG